MQVHLGIAQTPGGVALLRGLPGAHHAHALPPQTGAVGQGIDHLQLIRPLFLSAGHGRGQQEPVSQNFRSCQVYQVPVVGPLGILQIEAQYLVATADGGGIVLQPLDGQLLKLCHHDEQAAEPHLVPAAHEQLRYLAERCVLCGLYHFSRQRHLESQELVALAIFARPCLEEPHQVEPLLLIAQRHHIVDNFSCCRHGCKDSENRVENEMNLFISSSEVHPILCKDSDIY